MSNLFNSLGNKNQQVNFQQINTDPNKMLQQLKNNPSSFLKNRGFNIPDGININTNNPWSIINGLMKSGQIGNSRFQQVMQLMGGKIPRR